MRPRTLVTGLLMALGAVLLWLAARSRSADQAGTTPDERPGEAMAQDAVVLPGAPEAGIRVPNQPPLIPEELPAPVPESGSVIDLTNLIDAANGDPVLFNYFGAIREQIAGAAGAQEWAVKPADSGLVYVALRLSPNGVLRSAAVVAERSVESQPLRDAALEIVRRAAPFPPFPPSMPGVGATLVVPLEFLADS